MAIISSENKMGSSYEETNIYKLLSASTDGTTDALDVSLAGGVTFMALAGAGVSAGVLTVEAALSSSYSGTWASIGTVTINAASKAFKYTIADTDMPLYYVRGRLSTPISGGTVDVYAIVKR